MGFPELDPESDIECTEEPPAGPSPTRRHRMARQQKDSGATELETSVRPERRDANHKSGNGKHTGPSAARRAIHAGDVPQAFPARMPMGQFLFDYLYRKGVRHQFGVPGDFALPTYAW